MRKDRKNERSNEGKKGKTNIHWVFTRDNRKY